MADSAVFVTAILGGLLLLAWRRDRSTDALAWWGSGYLIGGASFALLSARGSIPNVLSIEIANALLLVGYGFLFAGTRAFSRRETPVTVFLIAPLIWLTAMRVPAIADDINLRVVVVSSLQCTLVALMAYELWRGRAEPLLSRWPAIILLITHAVVLNARIATVMLTPIVTHHDFFRSPLFALLAFGTVLYTITFAFLLLSMTKERSEMRHKIAADDRSAHRPVQPARLHERCRSRDRGARVAQRAARGAARRPRPFQEDQRRPRSCDRRPGADDLRHDAAPLHRRK